MSIFLHAVNVRHERRIRVLFTNTLDTGAFGAPAPAWYTLTNPDDSATVPTIEAALVVPGSPAVVELALSAPLVRGALYRIAAEGVPAVDSSSTDVGTFADFRWGGRPTKENAEPVPKEKYQSRYGIDLVWNGVDYQENALGDLDRVDGPANVTKALYRGVMTNPGELKWAPDHGAGAREFVDSPNPTAGTLKGRVSAQILRDPRVIAVKTTHEIEEEKTFINANATLITGEKLEPVSIEVPNQ